ncbi:hypothetical protein [uncultured Rikenella sp.]|uniref:hypothetical protein n=1 Tax=uncultured Rikenella sp. TaxID=368003 RepID=UPI00262D8A47|nr:hypothetical protein [uncultured Rikenella sp.]
MLARFDKISQRRAGKESPAPGFRHGASGVLGDIGGNSYSWSSAVSKINATYFYFSMIQLTPSNAAYRTYGFQLRCLSE